MNPVLLKPNSDTGSQVLLRGKPVGNMGVDEYVRFKPQALAAACECYDSLAAEFDAVVLEGAGSPGEVNLKGHDIVNMRMARHAGAPVLVVGDIDRGGVFASFVGTLEVLDDWERRLVAGWIVNRFRGDASLLDPALEYMLRRTGRPVLGVVPYMPRWAFPRKIRSSSRAAARRRRHGRPRNGDAVEIAVIDLPHISNFTDLDAFRGESDVRLRIVRTPADLQHPTPCSSPAARTRWPTWAISARAAWPTASANWPAQGRSEVVGICGGFQMLGREIRDPAGPGIGRGGRPRAGIARRRHGHGRRKDARPHHRPPRGLGPGGGGLRNPSWPDRRRRLPCPLPPARRPGRSAAASGDGRVWGTYLHGVFDADPFRRWFIDRLRVAPRPGAAGPGDRPSTTSSPPWTAWPAWSARVWTWRRFIA